MRRFEVARKLENGEPLYRQNVLSGMAEPVTWDVADEDMPEYATLKSAGADFRAAEDVIIPSLWGQVFKSGFADTTRTFTNSIREMFGNQNTSFLGNHDEDEAKKSMQPTIIHTGIKACMEEDEVLMLYNRSSLPRKLGLVLANSAGVIDADYYNNQDNDGEIMFMYYNFFPFDVRIRKGEKIGQGVFQKFLRAEGARIGSERKGGIGSTDSMDNMCADTGTDTGEGKKITLKKHIITEPASDGQGFKQVDGLRGLGVNPLK